MFTVSNFGLLVHHKLLIEIPDPKLEMIPQIQEHC